MIGEQNAPNLESVEQQLNGLREQLKKTSQQATVEVEKRDKLNEKFRSLRKEIQEIKVERDRLNEEVKNLKGQRNEAQKRVRTILAQINEHREKIAALRKKMGESGTGRRVSEMRVHGVFRIPSSQVEI